MSKTNAIYGAIVTFVWPKSVEALQIHQRIAKGLFHNKKKPWMPAARGQCALETQTLRTCDSSWWFWKKHVVKNWFHQPSSMSCQIMLLKIWNLHLHQKPPFRKTPSFEMPRFSQDSTTSFFETLGHSNLNMGSSTRADSAMENMLLFQKLFIS